MRADPGIQRGTPGVPDNVNGVDRLEARQGRRGNGWTGAILGAALGGAGGVVIAGADCGAYWGPCVSDDEALKFRLTYGALGVALGGAVGYVIGSVVTSERWEPVLVGTR